MPLPDRGLEQGAQVVVPRGKLLSELGAFRANRASDWLLPSLPLGPQCSSRAASPNAAFDTESAIGYARLIVRPQPVSIGGCAVAMTSRSWVEELKSGTASASSRPDQ